MHIIYALYWFLVRVEGKFYKHGLTLIPAWINKHMHSEGWDKIINPFPLFIHSGIKYNHFSKRGKFTHTLQSYFTNSRPSYFYKRNRHAEKIIYTYQNNAKIMVQLVHCSVKIEYSIALAIQDQTGVSYFPQNILTIWELLHTEYQGIVRAWMSSCINIKQWDGNPDSKFHGAPCWPHELCYLGIHIHAITSTTVEMNEHLHPTENDRCNY